VRHRVYSLKHVLFKWFLALSRAACINPMALCGGKSLLSSEPVLAKKPA
jgi:hypothetical protein